MGFFYVARNNVLGLCLILTLPSLGLIGHWTQGTQLDHRVLDFEGMGLFISVLSFVLFPVMLILSEFRKHAFVLYVISELAIVALLFILWMVAAILVIEERELLYPQNDCSLIRDPKQSQWCNELMAIQGLTITIFVFLLLYLLVLAVYAFVKHSQGHLVWMRSVKELQVSLPKVKLSHEPGELDAQGNPIHQQNGSLFGAPNTYPPTGNGHVEPYPQAQPQLQPQPQQYHQPQPQPQPQPTYASIPQAQPVQMQSTGGSQHQHQHQHQQNQQQQVTQSITYSRPPPGAQYPQPMQQAAVPQLSMYPNAVTQHGNGNGMSYAAQV